MVRLTDHADLSRETVRRRLAEDDLKPWRRKMWCIPKVDGSYVARMEDVLDRYAEPADPKRPVVCFDETPTQLIGEVRQPTPARPGQPERYDYEYKRNGTANLFMFVDAHQPWRHVKVTAQRTAADFAACMRDLADVHYPDAALIRVVQDNLSTHTAGALYEAFPAPEAHRILQRLEFHYTPKHASWLNMAEIEIGVLHSQCLDRRIGERDVLNAEIAAWERQRNASGARIRWKFTTRNARNKLARAYPKPANRSKPLCRGTSDRCPTRAMPSTCRPTPGAAMGEFPQGSPHFLQQSEERFEHGESADELAVFCHQRRQSMGWHVGDQVVEHRPLAEQRVGAALGGVGLEHAVIAQRLAGGAEQGKQGDGESVDQPQPVTPLGRADMDGGHAHAEA